MNLESASRKLCRIALAVSLGSTVVYQEASQATNVITTEKEEVVKPTLLLNNQEKATILAEASKPADANVPNVKLEQASTTNQQVLSKNPSKAIVISQSTNELVINQKESFPIQVNADSEIPVATKAISIPIKVEKAGNKVLTNSVNIPVVPPANEQPMLQQTESNPSVTIGNNIDPYNSSADIGSLSGNKRETLVSQQTRVIKPSSDEEEDIVSSVSIQIESYDPTTSPSVESMISPDLPEIDSPERFLPNDSQTFKGYVWPAKGVFTSGYGMRWGRMHRGIDIAAPIGTPIIAAADGKVITAGWNSGGYGNLVKLQHFDGSITLYAHNSKILVRRGQLVKQGQQIAKMGSTGFSTGPHLHFEIHTRGKKAVNPVALLPKRK